MSDPRTLDEKLEAMAAQSASPREAEVAREKLARRRILAAPLRGHAHNPIFWPHYIRWVEPQGARQGDLPIPQILIVSGRPPTGRREYHRVS